MTDDNTKGSEEKVYYDEGNVKITSSRAILDDKTYVLKNIASVTVNTIEHEAEKVEVGGFYTFGTLLLFFAFGAFTSEEVVVCLIFLLLGGAGFYFGYSKSQNSTPAWKEYSVRIGSNAGDSDSLLSKDKEYITKIVNAINDAIIEN